MCSSCDTVLHDACQRALLHPFIAQAASELASTRYENMLTEACKSKVISVHAERLMMNASDTLDHLVSRALSQENPLWGMHAKLAPNAKQMEARESVAEHIVASDAAIVDEVAPLLRPELERQTTLFVTTTLELLSRIEQDRHLIATELLGGGVSGDIGLIKDLDVGDADPHNGGRRTAMVTCEAGRFVYKPHDCQIDVWFARLVSTYLPDGLRQPRALTRKDESGDWGFAEFMERVPVRDEEGIARYWRNFGRAAALFQALGSNDLHCNNFVAAGELPSLVDTETVITTRYAGRVDPKESANIMYASKGFGHDLIGTLVRSGLLPVLLVGDHDISPLTARDSASLPLWDSCAHDICGYEDDFMSGFEESLGRLAKRADELANDVRLAARIPVRRVFRSTQEYVTMLRRLSRKDAYTQPKRDQLLGLLHWPATPGVESDESPLVASEIKSLARGDVPYFFAEAGSCRVMGSDGIFDDQLLGVTSIEHALEHVCALDEAHRSFYCDVVSASLHRALVPSTKPVPPCQPSDTPLSAEDAVEEADDIFRRLERLLITSPCGETSWLFNDECYALADSTVGFGNGIGGMAVFLAALLSRTRDEEVQSLASIRLDDCLDRLDEAISFLEPARIIREHSVAFGLADGLGGLLHTFDLVVDVLDEWSDPALCVRARDLRRRLLAILPHADVEHASKTDTYLGISGLLLALGTCPAAAHDAQAGKLAHRLADRLLELRSVGEGSRLWRTLDAKWPISGFAHGQAGIAAALATGAHAFGIDVGTAMRDALAFELKAYNARIGTWPDLRRKPATDRYLHGICSGAPGVGLAALIVAENSTEPDVRALAQSLLERADEACMTLPMQGRDVLCCGSLSPVEYLLSHGRQREAGCQLAGVVGRKRDFGSYVVYGSKWRQADDPSFLFGHAGIGYLLLRYADPSLPRVF